MSMSDYTGLDDAAELAQRLREHEADDMDHALDCESEDGRDGGPSALRTFRRFCWALYGLGLLVAVGSISVLAWVRTP